MKRSPLTRKTPLKATKPARKRASRASSGDRTAAIPEAVRTQIWARSGGKCEHCQRAPAAEMHHRLPRSRGGPHDTFNIVHLCVTDHHVTAHQHYHPDLMIRGRLTRDGYVGPDSRYQVHYGSPVEFRWP